MSSSSSSSPELPFHRFEEIDSTNAKIRELALAGAIDGTAVVARRQTAGRGRGDHTWSSPPGGVYLSLLLRARPGRPPSDLSFLGGVAMAQAATEFLPATAAVSVKWPNDCLANGRKVGGVLGEAVNDRVVLGLGLNVTTSAEALAPFQGNFFSATSLAQENGAALDVDLVATRLRDIVLDCAALYQTGGFPAIQRRWEKACRYLGRRIRLATGSDDAAKIEGTCLGIDDDGALVLSTQSGERRTYHSGQMEAIF